MTPAKLVFGREIGLPGDLMFGPPETQSQEPQNYSSQLENQLREMNRLIRGWLKIASDKMKTRYDIRSNSVGFQDGDQVWLYNPTSSTRDNQMCIRDSLGNSHFYCLLAINLPFRYRLRQTSE